MNLCVEIDKELLRRVRAKAVAQDTSMSAVVRKMLKAWVEYEGELSGGGGARSRGTPRSAETPEVTEGSLDPGVRLRAPAAEPPPPGKCPMFVPRGVKCKACGKVHSA